MTEIFPGYSIDASREHEILLRIVPPCSDTVAGGLAGVLSEGTHYQYDYDCYPATSAQVTGNDENGTIIRATPNCGVRDRNTQQSREEDALRVARRVAFLINPWRGGEGIVIRDVVDLGKPHLTDQD